MKITRIVLEPGESIEIVTVRDDSGRELHHVEIANFAFGESVELQIGVDGKRVDQPSRGRAWIDVK